MNSSHPHHRSIDHWLMGIPTRETTERLCVCLFHISFFYNTSCTTKVWTKNSTSNANYSSLSVHDASLSPSSRSSSITIALMSLVLTPRSFCLRLFCCCFPLNNRKRLHPHQHVCNGQTTANKQREIGKHRHIPYVYLRNVPICYYFHFACVHIQIC